jgi:hypothetical protein
MTSRRAGILSGRGGLFDVKDQWQRSPDVRGAAIVRLGRVGISLESFVQLRRDHQR